jgi:hypothetical protein
MTGLLYKEWLYTKRNARAIAIHVLGPLAVIAVNVVMVNRTEWASSDLGDMTVFFGFYTAVSFSTVFRAVERIRAELTDGTAHLYLLSTATPTRLAAVKFGFESAINLLAVVPFLGWLWLSRPGFIGPSDVLHTVVASIALTGLTFALSCFVRSDEMYRAVTLFLSMTPILPGLVLFGGQARFIAALIPTLTAFEGFRAIAADHVVELRLSAMLVCGLVISTAVTIWAYPKMFRYALTRPTA